MSPPAGSLECEAEMRGSSPGSVGRTERPAEPRWAACKQGVATMLIALFYTALIVVSILVCVYSVHSIFKASRTPVTSTKILEQDDPFDAPVFILYSSENPKSVNACSCKYVAYGLRSTPSNCTSYLLQSDNHRYLNFFSPETYKVAKAAKMPRTSMYFAYFKGPEDWRNSETLEITCEVPYSSALNPDEDSNIIEYLFLPEWNKFEPVPEEGKDFEIFKYLKNHPGMRFFPYGFENFVLISRTEIRDALSEGDPIIRLATETSLSLIDRAALLSPPNTTYRTSVKVGVQWKDGYVTDVRSFISATIWSAVSVVSTMLLMLEKAYGFAVRIYASFKSEREKKKILKQSRARHSTREYHQRDFPHLENGYERELVHVNRSAENTPLRDTAFSELPPGDAATAAAVSQFDMVRIDRNLAEINLILNSYNLRRRDLERNGSVRANNS